MRFFHPGIHTSDNVHLQPYCRCSRDKILTYCITAWDWNRATSIAHTVATGHMKSSGLPDCGRASVLHRNSLYNHCVTKIRINSIYLYLLKCLLQLRLGPGTFQKPKARPLNGQQWQSKTPF